MQLHSSIKAALLIAAALLLAACGGGGGDGDGNGNNNVGTPAAFTVGGTVSGLSGTGLVLQNNGGDNLTVNTNGNFTFATTLANGAAYNVTVLTQPTGAGTETCSVSNASGSVNNANVTNVAVTCGSASSVARFAYVGNHDSGNISAFSVDAATGALALISQAFIGDLPQSLAVDPNGRFLYVANVADTVAVLAIGEFGGLIPVPGSPFAGGDKPAAIAVHPSGAFVYVANEISSDVSTFAVDATTGALTPARGSPVASGNVPSAVAVDPLGRFVYVANRFSNNIAGFAVDATTGALAPVPNSPFLTGTDPNSIAIDPAGRFVYVANQISDDVSAFVIDRDTGELAPLADAPFLINAGSIAIHPTGQFLYAAGGRNIAAFVIDADTGALTRVPGSSFEAGTDLFAVTVDPSGQFAYVVDEDSRVVSAFRVDASTGALSLVSDSASAERSPRSIVTTAGPR